MRMFESGEKPAQLINAEKDAYVLLITFRSYTIKNNYFLFITKGVEMLYLILLPFSAVQHRIKNDGEYLDKLKLEDWVILTTAFAAEQLELKGFFDKASKSERRDSQTINTRDSTISKTELQPSAIVEVTE